MRTTISFMHLEHTEALDSKIHEKSEKLQKYFKEEIEIKWTCSVSNGEHYAEVKLLAPRAQYNASARTDCLYKTLDKVVGKLEKQMHKKKEVSKNHIQKREEKVYLEPEAAWGEHEDEAYNEAS